METYRHTQQSVTAWALIAAALAGLLLGLTEGPPPPLLPVVVAIMVLAFFSFRSLTVEVGGGELRIRFGIGLIRKSWQLTEIKRAEPVRNSWWYGWGIRLTPHGRLYNVSGLGAVEFELRDGKTFRVGTDEPQRLAETVRRRLGVTGTR